MPWLRGTAADLAAPDGSQTARFAAFLRSLHAQAPADAPRNPHRGVPLGERAAVVEARLGRLAGATELVTPGVRRAWADALGAPLDLPATWLHGDLHARNVLVEGGALTGIVDWGDITAADPATDLAAAWMLFARVDHPRHAVMGERTLRRIAEDV